MTSILEIFFSSQQQGMMQDANKKQRRRHQHSSNLSLPSVHGHAVAQTAIRWPPLMMTRVRSNARSWRICCGQNDNATGFSDCFVSLSSSHSTKYSILIFRGLCNRPISVICTNWTGQLKVLLAGATLLNAPGKLHAAAAASQKPKTTEASANSNQTTKGRSDNKSNRDGAQLLS
jgi:hypothetical protein